MNKKCSFFILYAFDTDTSILAEIASQQDKEWVGDGGQRKCNNESIQRVSLWYAVEPSPWVSVDVIFFITPCPSNSWFFNKIVTYIYQELF